MMSIEFQRLDEKFEASSKSCRFHSLVSPIWTSRREHREVRHYISQFFTTIAAACAPLAMADLNRDVKCFFIGRFCFSDATEMALATMAITKIPSIWQRSKVILMKPKWLMQDWSCPSTINVTSESRNEIGCGNEASQIMSLLSLSGSSQEQVRARLDCRHNCDPTWNENQHLHWKLWTNNRPPFDSGSPERDSTHQENAFRCEF